ncbi:hypothetical protein M9Y10_013054 [Tritrichomonas musculus]|uniref:L-methionine gamma-lyase n=1 Tax=Tritrichomonas musculus TaxID=1915356 RepID=A0ABR2I6B7_9EUKA
MEEHLSMASQCIHANSHNDQFGAVIPPIYQTSTFRFANAEQGGARFAGKEDGFMYTRLGNPTISCLEGKVAFLEGGPEAECACVSSGMAAISGTLLTILNTGDHMVADACLYGCTHSLFEEQFSRFGIEVDFIDTSIPGEVAKTLKPNTKVVYFETPSNPTMKIIDIERVAKEAHTYKTNDGHEIFVIIDNTFSSPIITHGLDHGADIIVQSMTKYVNGHTDVVSGAVVSRRKDIIQKIKANGVKDITGAVLSPHDAFLVCRGLLTLDLRVRKAAENAMQVAHFLKDHPSVEKVYYPGFETHPGHDIAKKQMNLFGSMITFELKGGFEAGKKLLNNLKLLVLAVSLGGCESLIQHPASMTHACVPKDERDKSGITDGMIRLSVGVEAPEDIIADLRQSLDKL